MKGTNWQLKRIMCAIMYEIMYVIILCQCLNVSCDWRIKWKTLGFCSAGKFAQVTNNPENDGCINAVLLVWWTWLMEPVVALVTRPTIQYCRQDSDRLQCCLLLSFHRTLGRWLMLRKKYIDDGLKHRCKIPSEIKKSQALQIRKVKRKIDEKSTGDISNGY